MMNTTAMPGWALEVVGADVVYLNAPSWFWDGRTATELRSPNAIARCGWIHTRSDTPLPHQCGHIAGVDGLCAWHRNKRG